MQQVGDAVNIFLKKYRERFGDALPNIFSDECLDISMIHGDYPVKEEVLWDNLELVLAVEKSANQCSACHGIAECRQVSEGFCPIIQVFNGTLLEANKECEFSLRRKKQLAIHRLLEDSKIPKRFRGKTFDDIMVNDTNREAVACFQWCLSNPNAEKNSIFLSGMTGSGKTLLSSIFAQEQVRRGVDTLFISSTDFFRAIKRSFSESETEAKKIIRTLYNVSCLVLDDFGSEQMSYWSVSEMYALINHRYNHMLQTIITSNLSMQTLRSIEFLNNNGIKVEDKLTMRRIASRLAEMCFYIPIESDSDYRRAEPVL